VVLTIAAALLAVERVVYVWIGRAPDSFRRWCARPAVARLGEPVAVVRALFVAFKALQAAVFAGWCLAHGGGVPTPAAGGLVLGAAGVLIVAGQALNLLVFWRLGWTAVFFGDRLGYDVPRCEGFPFSLLRHPQYVGSVLTIWGLFLAARFPYDDWALLPALETVYYAVGASLEDATPAHQAPAMREES
jgi:methylene-fatty-acyl-phospholipid synthase